MCIHQNGRQFVTLYHTSVDSLEEASSTGLLLQKKPVQSTCQLESSASTSPTLMFSYEVIIFHLKSS